MTRWELTSKYGTANVTGAGYLVKIKLPYPMRIAWDLDSTVNSMMCHKLVADNFTAVFNELLSVYFQKYILMKNLFCQLIRCNYNSCNHHCYLVRRYLLQITHTFYFATHIYSRYHPCQY